MTTTPVPNGPLSNGLGPAAPIAETSTASSTSTSITPPFTATPSFATRSGEAKSRFGVDSTMSLLVESLKDRLLLAVPKKGRLHEKCLELLTGKSFVHIYHYLCSESSKTQFFREPGQGIATRRPSRCSKTYLSVFAAMLPLIDVTDTTQAPTSNTTELIASMLRSSKITP